MAASQGTGGLCSGGPSKVQQDALACEQAHPLGGQRAAAPVRPMPLSTVALKIVGIAPAYRGCRQYGQACGQSVRLRCAGTTEVRGEYVARIA